MAHWLDSIADILKSNESNLIELAKIANVDPRSIFQHADLSQCDLRGQDLRGIDFTGSIIEGALLDNKTKIEKNFDPRIMERQYFTFRLSSKILNLVNSEAYYANYSYAVWFVKYLFEMAFNLKDYKPFTDISYQIEEFGLDELYSIDNRFLRRTIYLPKYISSWAEGFPYPGTEEEKYSFLLLSCLIFRSDFKHKGLTHAIEDLVDRESDFRKAKPYLSKF